MTAQPAPDVASPPSTDDLARVLDSLADEAIPLAPAATAQLRSLSRRLRRRGAQVMFRGRFSTGKSSLINCALGRPLLPTAVMTETGLVCRLGAGGADALHVCRPDGEIVTETCSTEALARHGSLRRRSQGRNADLIHGSVLEVELAGFSGGAATWIDAPGLDGGPEAERGAAAAREADVAVFVLRSMPFLTEAESWAIADQIAAAGPSSVVLVVNVVLEADGDLQAAWREALAEELPGWRRRIADQGAVIGLGEDWSPRLIAVSALAGLDDAASFGVPALRAMLDEYALPNGPAVRRVRLERLERELGLVLAEVRARLAEVQCEARMRREAAARRTAALAQARSVARAAVRSECAAYQAQFADAARAAAQAVIATIKSPPARDGRYERALNAGLAAAAEEPRISLIRRLKAREGDLVWPLDDGVTALARLLAPMSVDAAVPHNRAAPSAAAPGAIVGAVAVGAVTGGLGAPLGAVVGGLVTSGAASFAADAAGARENVLRSVENAVAAMSLSCDEAVDLVLKHCGLREPAPPDPEPRREAALRQLLARLEGLCADVSARLGGSQ